MRVDRCFSQFTLFVCLTMFTFKGFAEEFPVQRHGVCETEALVVNLEIGFDDYREWIAGLNPIVTINAICRSDLDFSDNLFSMEQKRADPLTDARGCVRGLPPCAAGQNCDEPAQCCDLTCTDSGGDGHYDTHCGSDDCDVNTYRFF